VLPPLSVWFKEKVCRKAPEAMVLGPRGPSARAMATRAPRVESKKSSRSDLRNASRALPVRPTLRTSSGPARAIDYSR
jgi:hypothetical protein